MTVMRTMTLLHRHPTLLLEVLSYLIGIMFGRWDIRYATGEKPIPELPDPFAPLPACPPGMLQGDDGLPLTNRRRTTRSKSSGTAFWSMTRIIPPTWWRARGR